MNAMSGVGGCGWLRPRAGSLGTLAGMLVLGCACVSAAEYHKFIVFDGVQPGANLEAGALVETWAGTGLKDDTVTIRAGTTRIFEHATPTRTATDSLNGATRASIINPVAGVNVAFGAGSNPLWKPAKITADDAPAHTDHNVATAKVGVFTEAALNLKYRNALGATMGAALVNAVTATLDVTATAGAPTDADKAHSADAWAGVFLANARTFVKQVDTPAPFTLLGKNAFGYAGVDEAAGRKSQSYVDPLFFEIEDLTSGDTWTEEVMRQTFTAVGADATVDDTGIHLTVNRHNPSSSVSFDFTSDLPWVSDPYSYRVTLDNAGLTLEGGMFPLAGWTLTTTADRIDAVYDLGPDGLPFDRVDVAPPDSLFTEGHEYRYGVGGGGGAFSIAVPDELPVGLVTAMALLGCITCARRRQAGPVNGR